VGYTLGGELLVVYHVDEVAIRRRIFTFYPLSLLCLGAFGGINIERDTAFLVIQIYGCCALGESCVLVLLVIPAPDDVWRLPARRSCRTPRPKLITCPVEGRDSLALHSLHPAQRAHVDLAGSDSHGNCRCLETSNGYNGALGRLLREGRASLQPGCHQVGAGLHLLDYDQGCVEQRDDARVVPQCIHSRVHLVK
jgi:hypothetical protein